MVSPSDGLRTESSFFGGEVNIIQEDLTIEPPVPAPVDQVKKELEQPLPLPRRSAFGAPTYTSPNEESLKQGRTKNSDIKILQGALSLLGGVFIGLANVGILSSPVGWGLFVGVTAIRLLSEHFLDEKIALTAVLGLFLTGLGFTDFVVLNTVSDYLIGIGGMFLASYALIVE